MLKPDEIKFLNQLEENIDNGWKKLNPWEKTFAEDVLEKYRIQGKMFYVSKKMWEKLIMITEKIGL